MSQGDIKDVKALLQARVLELAQRLMPNGYRSGKYWLGASRANPDKVGTFWVEITGRPGAWCDPVADVKGDILNLIAYREFGDRGAIKDAMSFARDFLGLGTMSPELRKKAAAQAQVQVVAGEKAQADMVEKNRKRAFALWLESKKLMFIGSPADAYLMSRGISVRDLTRMPGVLGWLPEHRHAESNSAWPCMLAGLTNDSGGVIAVHRTWLKLDGSGKAPIEPQRKIWPQFRGAAIRLWRGESKLSIDDAAAQGLRETLVLCEGIEDGLSSVLSAPQFRTWAIGALGNLQSIKLPECCDDVIVWRDNDWSKPEAARTFDKGIAALMAQGAKVRVARSGVGKDPNDALRGTE